MPNIHAVPPSSFLPPSAPPAVAEPRGATARRRLANLLALWLCSTSRLALAQVPSDLEAAARQAERRRNEMNQRIQQQPLHDLQSDQPPTRLQISPPTPRPRESTVCRDI